jgi:hypothetical protein
MPVKENGTMSFRMVKIDRDFSPKSDACGRTEAFIKLGAQLLAYALGAI